MNQTELGKSPDLTPYGLPEGTTVEESGLGVFWLRRPDGEALGYLYEDTTDWTHLTPVQRATPWLVRKPHGSGSPYRTETVDDALRLIAILNDLTPTI